MTAYMHRGSVETGLHQHEHNMGHVKEQAQLETCRVHRPWTRRRSSTPEYTTLIVMPELCSHQPIPVELDILYSFL